MDDGLQFVEKVQRTETYFQLCSTGRWGRPNRPDFPVSFLAQDITESGIREEMARYTTGDRSHWGYDGLHIRVWLPVHRYQDDAIPLEEWKSAQPVEEVQEVIEQSVEASEASTDEQPEVAKSGKFEVEVSAAGKPFTAYRGDSLEAAKATVTAHIGKCLRVQTRVHLSSNESFWVYSGKRANGLAWDSHEQWLTDLHAGAFDRAYARDYLNDLALQGKHVEAQREAVWFQEGGINV